MSVTSDLEAAKATLATRLATLSTAGLLSYDIDGQTVDRRSEAKAIVEMIAEIDLLLQKEDSPFEYVTIGVV